MTFNCIAWLLFMTCLHVNGSAKPLENTTSTDAKLLLKLGKDFNNPLLQLLGIAFTNTEREIIQEVRERELAFVEGLSYSDNVTFINHVCKLLECSEWSKWSSCPRGDGEFNMASRNRLCGVNNTLCTYTHSETRNEIQTKVCESVTELSSTSCPSDYELVDDTFCLKFVDDRMNHANAVNFCRENRGYVVNINSRAKSDAIHNFMDKLGRLSVTLWINGKRKSDGNYEQSYGKDTDYSNWATNEPSRGSNEKCKVDEGSPRRWWDRECSNNYNTVCEYVSQ